MASETPFKRPFGLEDTIISTPLPQATSTVDRKSSLVTLDPLPIDSTEKKMCDNIKKEDYLKVSIDTLALLREQLANAGLSYKPIASTLEDSAVSSTSNKADLDMNPESRAKSPSSVSTRASSLGLVDPREMMNLDTSDFLMRAGFRNDFSSLTDGQSFAERPFESSNVSLKHNTKDPADYTHLFDEQQDTVDNERTLAREKAFRTLSTTNRQLAEQSSFNLKSFTLKDSSVFPSVQQDEDQSGFSHIMRPSDLDREEANCVRKNNGGITHTEMSLSGLELTGSGGSFFQTSGHSLLDELGPADPPKEPRLRVQPIDTSVNVERGLTETMSSMSSMTSNIRFANETQISDISVPSIETLANILANTSINNPQDLVHQILTADTSSKNDGTSITLNSSLNSFGRHDKLRFYNDEKSLIPSESDISLRENENSDSFLSTFCATSRNDYSAFDSNSLKPLKKQVADEHYKISAVIGCETFATINASSDNEMQYNRKNIFVISTSSDDMTELKLMFVPIAVGSITVTVKDKGMNEIKNHIFEITCEPPMIDLSSVEVDFGTLPDQCVGSKGLTLTSKNTVPIKLKKVWTGDKLFELVNSNKQSIDKEIRIMPGEVIRTYIVFNVPELDNESPKTNYQGELRLLVNVPEVIKHAEMIASRVKLIGSAEKAKLSIKGTSQNQPYRANEKRRILVTNNSRIPLHINVKTIPEKQFSLPHDSYIVEPKSGLKLDITYTPTTPQPVDGHLCIRVVPDGSAMKVPLKGGATPELRSPSSALSNPLSTDSRSGSPNVSVPLSLESTTKSLIWGSVSRSIQVKRSCSLRNNSLYRERLNFTIVDPHNSFFFDIDGENKREFMITLDTMQTKEITVSLIPTILGPLVGTIQVTRIKNENEKKNIGLFGFGGRGLLRMGSVILDFAPGNKQVRMLLLNSSLTTDFTLHNFGDGESYFLIFQSFMEATCINALPSLGTIPVGSSIQINVSFRGDSASIKTILNQSKSLEIKLCTLLIVHGDEPTRLRLSKLYKKYGEKRDNPNVKHIMEELGRMVKAFSGRKDFEESAQVFKDPLSSLQYLFHEGIFRSEVDVLVNRRLLEEANLDSTVRYINLDNTLNDATSLTLTNFNYSDLNATESSSTRLDSWLAHDNSDVKDVSKMNDTSFTTPLNRNPKSFKLDRRTDGSEKSKNFKLE